MNRNFAIAAILTTLAWVASPAQGQLSRGHKLVTSNMAPGVASQRTLMGNRNLINHVQPVRLLTPQDSAIAIFANGTTITATGPAVSVGVRAGQN